MTNEEMTTVGGVLAAFFIFFAIVGVIALVLAVITIIAKWKLFEKAGEPGWSAIIPIYNVLQMFKIATGEYHLGIVWLILWGINMVCSTIQSVFNIISQSSDGSAGTVLAMVGLLFSLAGLVVSLGAAVIGGYLSYMFTKSYGKSNTMCILSIFFAPIIFMIMAFGKDTQYIGPQGHLRLWKKK